MPGKFNYSTTMSNLDMKNLPYENCLNCGTELQGKFCHKCGQQVTSKTLKLKDFLIEYANNAFIWDAQCLKTLWNLIRRPGHLTVEYLNGKFVSQEHPLKLNMFLLFVFVSLFLIFSNPNSDSNSSADFTNNELIYPALQLEFLKQDSTFVERLSIAPRDTVQIYAPLHLATKHPDVMEKIFVIEDTQGQDVDKWIAVIPRILIDDKIIIPNEDNYYVFNREDKIVASQLGEFKSIWGKLVNITTTYFPIIMLFTVPFLALAISSIQRKKKLPFINHFIFSLHYTAMIELLIMAIYILYLIAEPSMTVLQWVLRIGASLYLIAAYRRVYEPNSWVKAILNALFTYIIYLINCLLILFATVIIACIVIAFKTA